MAVRALIQNTTAETEGENIHLRWRHIFYGTSVPGTVDSGLGEVLVTPGMTVTQVKAAIKAAIQADCTALGYGTLQRTPQHVDEVFHNL
jgi:GH24 family phage-related lysozyme (muramidase)